MAENTFRITEYMSIRKNARILMHTTKMLNKPELIAAHVRFIKEMKREFDDFLRSRGYIHIERRRNKK